MVELARRDIIQTGGAIATLLATAPVEAATRKGDPTTPGWENVPMRWFQLAFTEDDPGKYDPDLWLRYFKEIRADGVCLSAGGGIAFYPTKIPYHGVSANMKGRDPFGEMVAGCRKLGMKVLARIDPHAMPASSFEAHPEWVSRNADGTPRRHWTATDLYLTCQFGPYNFELMPKVIDEISTTYRPDGFFGNRWSSRTICYCNSCQTLYKAATGGPLPATDDPATEEGRTFARWVEARMLGLIDLWNQTLQAKRPGTFFIPGLDRRSIVDYDGKATGSRLPLVFGDRQARSHRTVLTSTGPMMWNAGRFAKEMHAYMGDKPIGFIISVGLEEEYRWKDSVQSEAEIRMWTAGALAHGARPWVTKFNAKPLDTRWMPVVSNIYNWLYKNEPYFRNTGNLARVGLVFSAKSDAYLGGHEHHVDVEGHRRGYYQALLEARIPFDSVDTAFLDAASLRRYKLLILPNVAVLSDEQCRQIRDFVAAGGAIVATHETSLYDEFGKKRTDFALADLFGCHVAGDVEKRMQNSYVTLRHPHASVASLRGVERTVASVQRIPVRADGSSEIPLTLVPHYPDLPMERVFTDQTRTDIPMAFCRSFGKGRVVYLPMDLDRTFDELSYGDHLQLLTGFARWAAQGSQPMEVSGPGLVDMAYWRQRQSVTAHLVNLNNPMTLRGSYREAIPAGPYRVSLELPAGATVKGARLLEADKPVQGTMVDGRFVVDVPIVRYHEVVAIDLA